MTQSNSLFGTKPVGSTVQPCPLVEDNWVEIEYLYVDGNGVPFASYTLYDTSTDEQVASGTLAADGTAYVELPEHVTNVRVEFSDDTDVGQIKFTFPIPPNEYNYGWFERMSNQLNETWQATKDGASWTWELVQGDFNENPTVSQIISNAILTAIPVVDQVADVRDIIAALKQLVWDKRYTEGMVWFALFVTIIGLIPTVGSLVKGIVKLLWKGSKLADLLKLFNYFMKGNGIKWLKSFNASGLAKYADDAKSLAHDVFTVVLKKLKELQDLVPDKLVSIKHQIQDILGTLQNVKGQINGQFDNIVGDLNGKLAKVLEESIDASTGSAKSTINMQQAASDVAKDINADSILKGANNMSDEAAERAKQIGKQGEKSFVDPDSLKKLDDSSLKPNFTANGKVIPRGTTEADAISIRNKRNLDENGFLHRKGEKLKYDDNGFPIFDSKFDTHLSNEQLGTGKPNQHFKQANEKLAKQLNENPALAKQLGLTDEQVAHFKKTPPSGEAPGGLTWHHHQDVGRMQLIDSEIHDTFRHTGGMSIWGGGY